MGYMMFLDDLRDPPSIDWVVVRSTNDAMAYVVTQMADERQHTSSADYYAESRCGECGAVMLVKPRGRRRRCRACEEEQE